MSMQLLCPHSLCKMSFKFELFCQLHLLIKIAVLCKLLLCWRQGSLACIFFQVHGTLIVQPLCFHIAGEQHHPFVSVCLSCFYCWASSVIQLWIGCSMHVSPISRCLDIGFIVGKSQTSEKIFALHFFHTCLCWPYSVWLFLQNFKCCSDVCIC